MITGSAATEAKDLGIAMTTVLPTITPGTGAGATAMASYGRSGGPPLDALGAAVVALPARVTVDFRSALSRRRRTVTTPIPPR
jgi:hypothetical protein